MGLTFSGKTPIAVKATTSRTKTKAPILPNRFSRRTVNNPVAKKMARIPLTMRPVLNRMAVTPFSMPKSLRAFSVQLKLGEYAIGSSINVNAKRGASIPLSPDIFSQFIESLLALEALNKL